MAKIFMERGFKIVSDGTDNHLFLVDFITQGLTGKAVDAALGKANITINKNTVPNDPQSPFVTSGIRIGTPAITARGMKENEAVLLTSWICDVLDDLDNSTVIESVKDKVLTLCKDFPVYQ
jgi:glycine hydroxymethyltransferase